MLKILRPTLGQSRIGRETQDGILGYTAQGSNIYDKKVQMRLLFEIKLTICSLTSLINSAGQETFLSRPLRIEEETGPY